MPALTLSADDASALFARCCRAVTAQGRDVAPRGLPTVEIVGAELVLQRSARRFVDAAPHRVLNPAFAAAEALWILSGSDGDWIFTFNERLRRFADRGRLQGAYGPRLRRWHGEVDQLDAVRRRLCDDPATRQAVITLFDPARDFAGHRDVPCTLGHRFALRDGRLHMFTTMRSQDLWLGLPYDLFTFTILHELLSGWVGAEQGPYHHQVDSLHLYEHHLGPAAGVPDRPAPSPRMAPLVLPWPEFDAVLAQVIAGEAVGHDGWDDFSAVLASYRAWKRRDDDAARTAVDNRTGPLACALRDWYRMLREHPERLTAAPAAPAPQRDEARR